MQTYEILKRPIMTEKSNLQQDFENKFTFEVDERANKKQIKEAVEIAFEVDVLRVNTMIVPGKPRRHGLFTGRTSAWKKAIVTLAPGQHIDFFEGV